MKVKELIAKLREFDEESTASFRLYVENEDDWDGGRWYAGEIRNVYEKDGVVTLTMEAPFSLEIEYAEDEYGLSYEDFYTLEEARARAEYLRQCNSMRDYYRCNIRDNVTGKVM